MNDGGKFENSYCSIYPEKSELCKKIVITMMLGLCILTSK